MTVATVTAKELARILGVSEWAIYESIRRDACPVPAIRVGRRLVFSRAKVDALLGIIQADPSTGTDSSRILPADDRRPRARRSRRHD
jgi:predicted DNA-binding transcriptional regulator AlpA